MPSEVEQLREMARAYWAGRPIPCPKHPNVNMVGTFVQTTFADHVFLTCSAGKETIAIPQRPKQLEFQAQQVEGFVESMQRGDAILCYRCQAPLDVAADENRGGSMINFVSAFLNNKVAEVVRHAQKRVRTPQSPGAPRNCRTTPLTGTSS